jgi:hypothetical protein
MPRPAPSQRWSARHLAQAAIRTPSRSTSRNTRPMRVSCPA